MLLAVLLSAAAAVAPPPFQGSIQKPTWPELRFTYRAGCPVGPKDLRTLHVGHWGFDGKPKRGSIVVHRAVARDVLKVFRVLYAERFPIRRVEPASRYRGSDDRSMAADNTSGFNCRPVEGTSSWSMHAYGKAIDMNPLENPYVRGATVSPRRGRAFLDRSRYRKGMIREGDVVTRAFDSIGWGWGGRWQSLKDWQHFSTNGR